MENKILCCEFDSWLWIKQSLTLLMPYFQLPFFFYLHTQSPCLGATHQCPTIIALNRSQLDCLSMLDYLLECRDMHTTCQPLKRITRYGLDLRSRFFHLQCNSNQFYQNHMSSAPFS